MLEQDSTRLLYKSRGSKTYEVTYICRNCGHQVKRKRTTYDSVSRGGGGPIIIGGSGGFGGGGSIELIFVNNKKVIDQKYYNFGVVDITNKFESPKDDVPTCTFDDVYNHISELINDISIKADLLILAGGDHFYWYNNAGYELIDNDLYNNPNQDKLITIDMSDKYDKDALVTSLDRIRNNSDNPNWFDGSRAMKVITNYISHQVEAKYIIPTRINMEDGIKETLINNK